MTSERKRRFLAALPALVLCALAAGTIFFSRWLVPMQHFRDNPPPPPSYGWADCSALPACESLLEKGVAAAEGHFRLYHIWYYEETGDLFLTLRAPKPGGNGYGADCAKLRAAGGESLRSTWFARDKGVTLLWFSGVPADFARSLVTLVIRRQPVPAHSSSVPPPPEECCRFVIPGERKE